MIYGLLAIGLGRVGSVGISLLPRFKLNISLITVGKETNIL